MTVEEKRPQRKLIRDLILVLSLGSICAVLVALGTLYILGPMGSYQAGAILLSPEMMTKLSYNEVNPQTGNPIPYTFDKVEFQHFDKTSREWRRSQIPKEAYSKFYTLIASDKSLTVVPDNIVALFANETPSTLTLTVKKEFTDQNQDSVRSFQEVQIMNFGDYYRIEIHDQAQERNWAYFFHENIYEQAIKILL